MPSSHRQDAAISAARTARQDLGWDPDGPAGDVLAAVESRMGLLVAVLRLGSGVSGVYMRRGTHPLVFLHGADDVARQRFTLAHELGHHLLGHGSAVDTAATLETGGGSSAERQANTFAGELLAPEPALRRWMDRHDDPPLELEVVVHLAMFFNISTPAVVVRLAQADILQRPADHRKLMVAIRRGTHKGIERRFTSDLANDTLARIAAESSLPRLPPQLHDNALGAYIRGEIDIERLARLLRRDVSSVQAMTEQFGIAPGELLDRH